MPRTTSTSNRAPETTTSRTRPKDGRIDCSVTSKSLGPGLKVRGICPSSRLVDPSIRVFLSECSALLRALGIPWWGFAGYRTVLMGRNFSLPLKTGFCAMTIGVHEKHGFRISRPPAQTTPLDSQGLHRRCVLQRSAFPNVRARFNRAPVVQGMGNDRRQ